MPVLMTTPTPSSRTLFPVTTSGSGTVTPSDLSMARPAERMRLRPWLIRNIEEKRIPGLEWLDEEERLVKIPWKHAARHGWTCDRDASLFRAWAIHTKKYDPMTNTPKANPKIWKANFRCAINSLPDIEEVKGQGKSKGNDAFKIYKLNPKKTKKSRTATTPRKTSRGPKSRTCKFTERHRVQSTSSQIFSKSHESHSGVSPTQEQYVNELIQAHGRSRCFSSFWDESVRTDISQSQRTTEPWASSITYTNRLSPIRHDLSLYPTPPSSTQGPCDPLNLASPSCGTPVTSPPAYPYLHHHHHPHHRSTASCPTPLYAISGSTGTRKYGPLAGSRSEEILDYMDSRQRDGVSNHDGYQDMHEAESNCSSVPSDEEIIEIVHEMTKNSPVNSPTRASPFDNNNNSNSSSYWKTSTFDNKNFLSDERMIPSASDLSIRPPPPDYHTYTATSHALKAEARSSCDYMKAPNVYRELTESQRQGLTLASTLCEQTQIVPGNVRVW